jgi:hypothetical protein
MAESAALFVRDRYFDRSVAPVLLQFRNRGGRISDLEREILAARDAFQPQFLEQLSQYKLEFDQSVRDNLERLVGRELARAATVDAGFSQPSVSVKQSVAGSVAGAVGDGLGATLVVGITATVASLSGGVGHSLGIAVISALLGTSGPVGMLLGGLLGLVVGGAGYMMGRDKLVALVKERHLPATLVAMSLGDSKIDGAREAIYAQVKAEVAAFLEPQVSTATEAVLQQMAAAASEAVRA